MVAPFVFLLQLHFQTQQFVCTAARTALNTKEIVSSLRGWDCPHRDKSAASSLAQSSASEECERRLELRGESPCGTGYCEGPRAFPVG